MKDKDPNEDEFNQDEQDNINEADDSFGLPDLDFNTLEEASEEEAESEEDTNSYADESEEEEVMPEKRTYVPPKAESNAPKIIMALIATIIVSVAVWYFVFYRPQAQVAEKARIEAENKRAADARKAAEAKKLEEQRLAEQQAAAAKETEVAEKASFRVITEPTKRYYVVVSSSIDADAAADYGNKLVEKGYNTALLAPKGKKKFNRLTIGGNYSTFVEAQEAANKLKSEFGDWLWVVKY